MDLRSNDLGLPGMELLCEGLQHPKCRLQMIQLRKCPLEVVACQDTAFLLITKCTGGFGHWLRILQLKICQVTAAACEDLTSTLSVNQSLAELDLNLNDLGNPSAAASLSHLSCKLQVLWLFGTSLKKMTHRRLTALHLIKPYLDIGCRIVLSTASSLEE
eukprot:bmy_21516T0